MNWRDWVWFHTRPPLDRFRDQRGICSVCSGQARFLYNRWAVSREMAADMSADVADAYRRRESSWCHLCGASARERGLWAVLQELYGSNWGSLRVAEINRMNAGHDRLAAMADVTYVEYPQEDLQALSFPDRSFDLVITSDTLEHVPDWRAGLRETQRILRPGGRHVFTVPTRPDLEHTRSRDGMPPIYHGEAPGPLKLVHRATDDNRLLTDFGRDFVPIVAAFGFAVETRGSGVETVFVARKGT